MLGEALSMLVPQVVGFRLTGALPRGRDRDRPRADGDARSCARPASSGSSSSTSATGSPALPLADRATIGNMSPEYGATCGFFPVDDETLDYLRLTGRQRRAGRARRGVLQGEPALARPARARRRTRRSSSSTSTTSSRRSPARAARRTACRSRARSSRSSTRSATFGVDYDERPHDEAVAETFPASDPTTEHAPAAPSAAPTRRPWSTRRARAVTAACRSTARTYELDHGSVVIAAITSCTNTSNPPVMIGAGLLAKKAVERGLDAQAVGEVVASRPARRS